MKHKIALLCIGMGLLCTTQAQAEHRLFPTDVLEFGQFEAEVDFFYSHSSYDFTLKNWSPPITGTTTYNSFASGYEFGAGLGNGLQLHVALPYYFKNDYTYTYDTSATTSYRERDGVGDFMAGVKYRLYQGKQTPVTVVTGVDIKFDTADTDKAGTGTTNFSPYLTASLDIDRNLRAYASYYPTIRNHGAVDTHPITVGMQYEINPVVTLKPALTAAFVTDSDQLNGYESVGVGIDCYLQVMKNLYLIPGVSYSYNTSTSTKNGSIDYGELNAVSTGLRLYYFFN